MDGPSSIQSGPAHNQPTPPRAAAGEQWSGWSAPPQGKAVRGEDSRGLAGELAEATRQLRVLQERESDVLGRETALQHRENALDTREAALRARELGLHGGSAQPPAPSGDTDMTLVSECALSWCCGVWRVGYLWSLICRDLC